MCDTGQPGPSAASWVDTYGQSKCKREKGRGKSPPLGRPGQFLITWSSVDAAFLPLPISATTYQVPVGYHAFRFWAARVPRETGETSSGSGTGSDTPQITCFSVAAAFSHSTHPYWIGPMKKMTSRCIQILEASPPACYWSRDSLHLHVWAAAAARFWTPPFRMLL